MKYYLIAGEASGDLHASNLIQALSKIDPQASFRAMGGDLMEARGATLDFHFKSISFMGFFEVLTHLFTIKKRFNACKAAIQSFRPDALILIDFSGFNLRMAQWAKRAGFQVHYYIAPQVWASRPKRIETIKESVDHLYVTLPFEPDFYAKHHYKVHFVGHPLLDALPTDSGPTDSFHAAHGLDDRPIIALLPGSRTQEIRRMLPAMLAATSSFTNYQVLIAGAPGHDISTYEPFIDSNSTVLFGVTQSMVRAAHMALVTSGTATLETALLKTPQVVCYKTSPLTYALAKRLVKLNYISLVNLILDKPCVTELIQEACTPNQIALALQRLEEASYRAQMLEQYALLEKMLGQKGASERAAKGIYENTLFAHQQATGLSR
ncbi:MAG: lipid-A-disaccharide synthase [Bacteroidota bacterium]